MEVYGSFPGAWIRAQEQNRNGHMASGNEIVPLPQPLTTLYVISDVIAIYMIFLLATAVQKAGYNKAGVMMKMGSAGMLCDAVAHLNKRKLHRKVLSRSDVSRKHRYLRYFRTFNPRKLPGGSPLRPRKS